MEESNRVVVLIDMDCFYCQVEEKLNPELKGKPIAVVQYNPWKGGGIIAVNYVARALGVTRHMRGNEAKEKCPEIHLPSVPCQRGKADINKYREAGIEVAKVLQKFTPLLERASIDEAYLDITQTVKDRLSYLKPASITPEMTPNTFALGYDSVAALAADARAGTAESLDFDLENCELLLAAAVVVSEIRAAVYAETGYRCSAGIAHNKILAKLVCGMNKPDKQTLLPKHALSMLYETLPLKKVKHLGGKFGDAVSAALGARTMGQLRAVGLRELQDRFDDKNGLWLYNIARGVDNEPVTARFNPKSIGCCKQFKGKNALLDLESLRKWLKDLGDEIDDRLERDALENSRNPKQMVVSFATQLASGKDSSSSRSYNFGAEDDVCSELFYSKALELILDSMEGVKPKENEGNRKLQMPVKFLGISVGKFEDNSDAKKTKRIVDYFTAGSSKETSNKENVKLIKNVEKEKKTKGDKEFMLQKYFQSSKEAGKSDITCKVHEKVTLANDAESGRIKLVSGSHKDEQESYFAKCDKVNVDNGKRLKESALEEKSKSEDNQVPVANESVLESSLDKQESFFAKLLCDNLKPEERSHSPIEGAGSPRPATPGCGDNTNDSDYSSSTINNEINQSINLFEDSPQDVVRITNIRNLLKTSTVVEEDLVENYVETAANIPSPQPVDSIKCVECNKDIPTYMIETHADYHLALKLRDEERQQVRQERERTIKTTEVKVKPVKELVKVETNTSIANFLVKLDDTATESCSMCGKKVGIEKISEHMDFHEAQRLSRELNNRPAPRTISTPKDTATGNLNRKRKATSVVKNLDKRSRPIDSFFR